MKMGSNTQLAAQEVYVVMDGNKVGGIYHWKEDAQEHAQAVGGMLITQNVRYGIPTWIKTMNESALEKARLQNPGVRK